MTDNFNKQITILRWLPIGLAMTLLACGGVGLVKYKSAAKGKSAEDKIENDPTPITLVSKDRDSRRLFFDADGNPETIEYVGRMLPWTFERTDQQAADFENFRIGSHNAASNVFKRLGSLSRVKVNE